MGLAIQSTLENGIGQTTLEFQDYARAAHHARDGSDQSGGHCA